MNSWNAGLLEAQQVLSRFIADTALMKGCETLTTWMTSTIQKGGTLFACGNGGSHCDALHFAEEWTGRYRKNRRAIAALALGDAPHVTCVGNDFGFEEVFSRQIEALGRPGDLLMLFTTSGRSRNLIRAAQAAKTKGLRTVGLLGRGGGELRNLVDLPLVVPGETSDRIQELHIKIVHLVIEAVERELFPENYAD